MLAQTRYERSSQQHVRNELRCQGFSFWKGTDYQLSLTMRDSLNMLIEDCRHLPADPRAKNGERCRRYARFVYVPWTDAVVLRPVATYFQDSGLNRSDGGIARHFAGLTQQQLCNSFLHDALRADFSLIPISPDDLTIPWDVGVHLVQMIARPNVPGISSPDCLHKDGEPFTFVHLLDRQNVLGGENVITNNAKMRLLEITLTNTLDSLAVRDEAVFHQVTPIEVTPGKEEGTRTALLIDFTPMSPQTIKYSTSA